jgi:hypothetical protein
MISAEKASRLETRGKWVSSRGVRLQHEREGAHSDVGKGKREKGSWRRYS